MLKIKAKYPDLRQKFQTSLTGILSKSDIIDKAQGKLNGI